MNKILLTGSTGFIGSNLLNELSKNNQVFITIRKKNKNHLKNKNIKIIYFNNYNKLNNSLKKIEIDTVIHCATHYIKNHKISDVKKLSDSNILFGNIILENLAEMNVKKFINFSTVWENYDGIKNNYFNLYSVYKKSFNNLIDFYKKKFKNIKFYNLVVSDTFGENDKRNKLINLLRKNYILGKATAIVSKGLTINLINILDIITAINLILKRKIIPNTYILKNQKNFLIYDIVNRINKNASKKIKIRWLSKKKIKVKFFKYKIIKSWRANNSNIQDIVDLIKR